jgi:hypothetical protein
MDGKGLLVIVAFLILILAILTYSSCNSCKKEGFDVKTDLEQWDSTLSKPQTSMPTQPQVNVPVVGPGVENIKPNLLPGYTSIADLPSAPVNTLASVNSLPYQDPALEKSSRQMINELKKDMDGFAAFEAPYLQDRSDPAVKLPLMRFQGDYQRVKDELSVITQTPSLQPQLTIQDLNDMGANLRFLQRTYRVYADNQMVPPPRSTNVKEGFQDASGSTPESQPISKDQLMLLSQKLAVEITRLQASGTNDPVTQARVNVFTKMKQSIDSINISIQNGTMDPTTIPIKVGDYNKFLPALGNNSAGISGLLSKSGYPTLSSLFNAYDAGDISGSQIAAHLMDTYAESLLKGLSYKLDFTYTSPNEIALRQAEATVASSASASATGTMSPSIRYSSYGDTSLMSTNHPLTMFGARGGFDAKIRQMDIARFTNDSNHEASQAGSFDWKKFSDSITKNVRSMGLNSDDFGIMADTTSVGSDFSWRGYTKMVCTRLATHSDPGVPEQCGCPPVSWKGWSM